MATILNLLAAMRKHNGMRPQDVVILLKLVTLGESDWRYEDLSAMLSISKSEIAESLTRSQQARLVDSTKRKVFKTSLIEFLVHGFRYVFPVPIGTPVFGTPTMHCAPPLRDLIPSRLTDKYVWANSYSGERGLSVPPLHPNVPLAIQQDAELYMLLALCDVMRLGTSDDRALAAKELTTRINATYGVKQTPPPSHF